MAEAQRRSMQKCVIVAGAVAQTLEGENIETALRKWLQAR